MHVPDHLIDRPTELVAGLGAAAVIAAVAFDTREHPGDGPTLLRSPQRLAPQAATAAVVFALQMVNVPVLSGTSGHLLGGALATALIGPRRALLAMSAVVTTQALVFADGGTAALGVNLWLLAVLPVALAWAARHLLGVRDASGARFWAAVAAGAVAAPVVSAGAFAALFALGGPGGGAGQVATSMVGVHARIAVVELGMTVAVLALLVAWRRVHGDATAAVWATAGTAALGLSLVASSAPDGLERVLGDLEVAVTGPGSILSASPFADYSLRGMDGLAAAVTAAASGLGLVVVCSIALAASSAALGAQARRA